MRVETYGGNGYAANCYIVTDAAESACVVVDPSVDVHTVFRQRGKTLPPLAAILLTHAHFDHMLALDDWRNMTGAPLLLHTLDAPALADPEKNVYRLFLHKDVTAAPAERLLSEGDTVRVGDEALTVWHTPGHTPGSVVFAAPGILLTGDTLFAGDIGRTDLPGGNATEMRASLACLSRRANDTDRIYPGHGGSTTFAFEKLRIPYLKTE